MPHYKCVPCKIRLHSDGSPGDLDGDECPECRALLEPVAALAEVVGFRSTRSPDSAPDGAPMGIHEPIADLTARRELAQAGLDAGRWIDEGGTLQAEAVALPHPDWNA